MSVDVDELADVEGQRKRGIEAATALIEMRIGDCQDQISLVPLYEENRIALVDEIAGLLWAIRVLESRGDV